MLSHPRRLLLVASLGMGAIYLFCFSFSFFRHDDWRILGEGLRVLSDPERLWLPSLQKMTGEEEIWFLRPWFKLIPILVFQAGQGTHLPFLLIHLVCLGAGCYWGFRALEELAGRSAAWSWLVLFIVCFHSHAGSVLWLGEGMMNLPILALLSLNLYWFVKQKYRVAAIALFVFTLGFKEATVFHVLLLGGIVATHPRFKPKTILPYAIIAGAYLLYRFTMVPVQPQYLPVFNKTILHPLWELIQMVGFTAIATAIVVWLARAKVDTKRLVVFVPFAGISIAPYVGHPFFSPGWVTLPLFFLTWIVFFSVKEMQWHPRLGLALLVIGVIDVAGSMMRLNQRRWFEWGPMAKQFVQQLRAAPPGIEQIWMEKCHRRDAVVPEIYRILGDQEMMGQAWLVLHRTPLKYPVEITWCNEARPTAPALVFTYHPPNVTLKATPPSPQ